MNQLSEHPSRQQYQQARQSRDPRFDGRFFVGVKTTGIFCRNICPVKLPKEENVEYYDLAAQAMQAGFRPCLRCRPDSAPGSFAWQGVETTLHRAMQLLKQHPEISLQTLCDKLGITDRYLRKLFQDRLGISPKHYQITEQLLFAKRLLHETSLSIEQIAQSCGFNSSRRLQENMQQHFRLTPSQVRQQETTATGKLHLKLDFREPYNWPQVRDFLALRAINDVELVSENSYQRNFTLGETSGHFIADYDPQARCFNLNLELDNYSQLGAVIRNIRRILDLDADSNLIQSQLTTAGIDEGKLVTGLRLPGVWSLFEAGVRAILGQQVSVKAAIGHVNNLVQNCNNRVNGHLQFPTPTQVQSSPLDYLRMPGARKETLRRLAEYCARTEQNEQQAQPDEWLQLKGIGPWTIAYAKMRGLSDPDVWLNTDLVIKKQLQQHSIDADIAAPWRSYLTFQLWSMA